MTEDASRYEQGRSVGFVGLGAMGAHMAARLIDAGHALAVFDTRAEAMEPHVARGALACASPAAVADAADTVLVSLPTPDVVREVADGLLAGGAMRAYVDLSTTGPAVAAQVAATLRDARRRAASTRRSAAGSPARRRGR